MNPRGLRGASRGLAAARQALCGAVLLPGLLCVGMAWAQDAVPNCPAADQLQPVHLYGLWHIRLWPEGTPEPAADSAAPSVGALLFERHPEYPGSVRGELRRSANGHNLTAQVSGDVTDGVFNLDESEDGQRISAVWVGDPQDCGRSIRGTRRPAEGRPAAETTLQFHLRKLPGWR